MNLCLGCAVGARANTVTRLTHQNAKAATRKPKVEFLLPAGIIHSLASVSVSITLVFAITNHTQFRDEVDRMRVNWSV